MNNSFEEFINSSSAEVPDHITNKIKNVVVKDLKPNLLFVVSKIFTIQLVVGTSTLFLCSQFGVSFFNIKGLRHIFMVFGEIGCMSLCGSLFIGAGATVAMLTLRPEEIKLFWRLKEVYYSVFSLIFLLSFYFLGTEHMHMSMFVAWFLGSFVSSKLVLIGIKKLRFPKWNNNLIGQN